MNKAEHHMERIVLDKKLVDEMEQDMLIKRHIERYALVRQYAFGNVLDAACGVGYGSYLMAKNPDVITMHGVDCDQHSIDFARKNFSGESDDVCKKISFECNYFKNVEGCFDVLVSMETIEHLENPQELADMAERCHIKEIILSYPMKKTTHYNKYHLWDFTRAEIESIFRHYECIQSIKNGDSDILHFIQRGDRGIEPRRYWNRI